MLFDRLRSYEAFDDIFAEEERFFSSPIPEDPLYQCEECGEWFDVEDAVAADIPASITGVVCPDCYQHTLGVDF